jgi:hypothetical protein
MKVARLWFLLVAFPLVAAMPACNGNDDDSAGDYDAAPQCTVDNAGHAACNEDFGDMYFCSPDELCIESEGCLAEGCCLLGEQGDSYCEATFGAESVCLPDALNGGCTNQGG